MLREVTAHEMNSMARQPYTERFFRDVGEDGASAAVIVPLVLQYVDAKSIVDVGCGVGRWLAEFQKCGVEDVLGIDGDYVPRQLLQIASDRFRSADLSRPVSVGRRFDLAVSLEVAEHLPAAAAAEFVSSLAGLAPVVLFSAAIPLQGGTQHLNEQWPEYWAELFAQHRFEVVDCLRGEIWWNPSVRWWYAQNIFFFVSEEGFSRHSKLRRQRQMAAGPLAAVHPRNYLRSADLEGVGARTILAKLPLVAWRALRKRLRRAADST